MMRHGHNAFCRQGCLRGGTVDAGGVYPQKDRCAMAQCLHHRGKIVCQTVPQRAFQPVWTIERLKPLRRPASLIGAHRRRGMTITRKKTF